MKKFLIGLTILLTSFFVSVEAKDNRSINIHLFYGNSCSYCHEEQLFLSKLEKKYNIKVIKYEVWKNEDNQKFLDKICNELEIKNEGVPTTIIGNTVINGYNEANSKLIERAIKFYLEEDNKYVDSVNLIRQDKFDKDSYQDLFSQNEEQLNKMLTINFPFIKNLNLKNLTFNTSLVLLGLVSSFNIMVVVFIIFLLGFIMRVKDERRRNITGLVVLGIVFLSLIVQYAIGTMISLELFDWVLKAFGLVLILLGIFNLCEVEYFKNKFIYYLIVVSSSILFGIVLFNLNSDVNLTINILKSINEISIISNIFNSIIFCLFYLLIVICLMFVTLKLFNKFNNKYVRGYLIFLLIIVGFLLI